MKYIILVFLLSSISQITFSQKYASWNYQAECVDASIGSATKVKITNFDKKTITDIDREKKMALHAILVKGAIGGSNCISQPPLLQQSDIDENKSYFKALLGKKAYYNKYIISVEEVQSNELDKNKIKQRDEHSAIITVNKDLLRKDLTNDKIIKSLNQGF